MLFVISDIIYLKCLQGVVFRLGRRKKKLPSPSVILISNHTLIFVNKSKLEYVAVYSKLYALNLNLGGRIFKYTFLKKDASCCFLFYTYCHFIITYLSKTSNLHLDLDLEQIQSHFK